ncbi:MAG: glutathione S-transferase family protein [Microcystaceae cyanobacterium]
MLKLYHLPISFNSRRVWVTLLEKNLAVELIPLKLNGDQFTPEFLALNPFHHIPVLVDGEVSLFESLAILDYIEAKYPTPSLVPSEPYLLGQVKMIEMVTVNEFIPQTTPLVRQTMGLAEVEQTVLEKSKEKIAAVLAFFEQQLETDSYLVGDQLTLADIVAGTGITILPMIGLSLSDYPKTKTWLKTLMQRESFQQTQAKPEEIEEFKTTMKKMMSKPKQ